MTLIIKELVIRGIVTQDQSELNGSSLEKAELQQYLEKMKKDIEKDCLDKISYKLKPKTTR